MVCNVISVDAGGTKTKAALISPEGKVVETVICGPGNLLIHFEKGTKEIICAIQTLLQSHEAEQIVIGAAGLTRQEELSQSIIRKTGIQCTVMSDAELGYMSLMEGREGIVTLAGTGSVTIAYKDQTFHQRGGWGHLLGDEGSAYDVAIKSIKKVIAYLDGHSAQTEFVEAVMNDKGWRHPQDIKKFVYNSTKTEISKLSAHISSIASAGNTEAVMLFEEAGQLLGEQTLQAAEQLFGTSEPAIGVQGSMLTRNPIVQSYFENTLRIKYPDITIAKQAADPILGGFYYMKRRKRGGER